MEEHSWGQLAAHHFTAISTPAQFKEVVEKEMAAAWANRKSKGIFAPWELLTERRCACASAVWAPARVTKEGSVPQGLNGLGVCAAV